MSTLPLTHAAAAPRGAAEEKPPSPNLSSSPRGIGAAVSSIAPSQNSTEASATVVEETKSEALIISVEVQAWSGKRTETVTLDVALENNWITPQEAVQKAYCSQDYLIRRGYGIIKFQYKTLFGSERGFWEGTLRKALREGFFTIEEAIEQKYITRAQAIECGLLKTKK